MNLFLANIWHYNSASRYIKKNFTGSAGSSWLRVIYSIIIYSLSVEEIRKSNIYIILAVIGKYNNKDK